MKKIILLITVVFFSVLARAQTGFDGLRTDSTLHGNSLNATGVDTIKFISTKYYADSVAKANGGGRKVDTLWRTSGVDSIYFKINGTTYAIKDSIGSGGSGISLAVDTIYRTLGKDSIQIKNTSGLYYAIKDSSGLYCADSIYSCNNSLTKIIFNSEDVLYYVNGQLYMDNDGQHDQFSWGDIRGVGHGQLIGIDDGNKRILIHTDTTEISNALVLNNMAGSIKILYHNANGTVLDTSISVLSGVTSISTASPITGGTITSTGTIGLNKTAIDSVGSLIKGSIGSGFTSIPNSALSNSSLTVNAGVDLTGGGAVSLGGSTTLNADTSTGITKLATQGFVARQGFGSGTVSSISTSSGITGGTITTSGTLKADTGLLATNTAVHDSVTSQGFIKTAVTSIATTSGILGGTITTTGTLKADTSLLATNVAVHDSVISQGFIKTAVTSVATGYGLSGGTITTTGTLIVDSTKIGTPTSIHDSLVANSQGFGKGSVTSVGLTVSNGILLGGTSSPITSSGTYTLQVDSSKYRTIYQGAHTWVMDTGITFTGWSSFTSKFLQYRYDPFSHTCDLQFFIAGTSNSVNTSFPLPFTFGNVSLFTCSNLITAGDAGSSLVAGEAQILTSATTTLTFFRTPNGNTWTASGTKTIVGQISYRTQ